MVAAGGETAAIDWLNVLELMNMYQKHLDDNELDTLLAFGPDTVAPMDPSWVGLVDEVRDAMRRALPAGGANRYFDGFGSRITRARIRTPASISHSFQAAKPRNSPWAPVCAQ